MNELYYKIKRAADRPATTWIGSTGCKRVFDSNQDTFIVNEIELGICLHHGNFKLVGPAPASEIPSQPTPIPVSEPESVIEEEAEEEPTSDSED